MTGRDELPVIGELAEDLEQTLALYRGDLLEDEPDLQWVQTPFGDHRYIEPAVVRGLKLSPGVMTWRWRNRDFPLPVLEANVDGAPPGSSLQRTVLGVPIYERAAQPYAAVFGAAGVEPCQAEGVGGQLTIRCQNSATGSLIVAENRWSGWQVWRDWHATAFPENEAEIKALEADRGRFLGFIRVVGCRREEVVLTDPIISLPTQYTKQPLLR